MPRKNCWILPAGLLLLAALSARGEDKPAVVTTLPRPSASVLLNADIPPVASNPPGNLPLAAPGPSAIVETAPELAPIGAEEPFNRRVRADLLEVAILFPVVNQSLASQVTVAGIGQSNVRLPTASFGVAAPFIGHVQFDAWRYGELDLSYKLLAAEGNAVLLGFDPAGPAILRSRLDMNVVDLNFTSSGYTSWWNLLWFINDDPVKPRWGVRWDVGARFATVFFDNSAFGPTLIQHASSFFIGGGPRVGLTLHHLFGDSGVMAFYRVDLGSNLGSVHQQFSELDAPGGVAAGFGYADQIGFRWVPTLSAQLGVGGEPPFTHHGRWQVAYQFEQWWGVGSTAHGGAADLVTHGVVLRWFYRY